MANWKKWGAAAGIAVAFAVTTTQAQIKYDPGASDTEIRLGQTFALSGPVSSEAGQTRVHQAYVQMINEKGGIRGRKLTIITADDGYSPPRTLEGTRKLVEQDRVFAIFNSFGTPTSAAAQRYLNANKIPQLFVGSGASRFSDAIAAPWSLASLPSYEREGAAIGKYLLRIAAAPGSAVKEPKVAILYQNDDFGRDYVRGLRQGLGAQASEIIVKEISYEPTDPTIDSQLIALQASGANVFMNFSLGRHVAQAIRRAHDSGWKPLQFISGPWSSIEDVLKPAGIDKSIGIVSIAVLKEPLDPRWRDDPGMNEYRTFMKRYAPDVNANTRNNALAYLTVSLMVKVLEQAGDNLTRQNVMDQALAIRAFNSPVLLPGITASTTPTQRSPYSHLQIVRFDGEKWVPDGALIGQ